MGKVYGNIFFMTLQKNGEQFCLKCLMIDIQSVMGSR